MNYRGIKGLIFDRDGTLIEHVHYLADPNMVKLLPGVKSGLKLLKEKGFRIFLHSNQSGVGRGFFSISDVEACNNKMKKLLEVDSKFFDKVCIATEKPDGVILYRKPSSKFGREIMKDFCLHSGELCYIGDRISDLQAAIGIGSPAIGVNTGLVDLNEELAEHGLAGQFPVFNNFDGVVKYLTCEAEFVSSTLPITPK